jgi:hypothetical protein
MPVEGSILFNPNDFDDSQLGTYVAEVLALSCVCCRYALVAHGTKRSRRRDTIDALSSASKHLRITLTPKAERIGGSRQDP